MPKPDFSMHLVMITVISDKITSSRLYSLRIFRPFVGLTLPVLLKHEHYEQMLTLSAIALPIEKGTLAERLNEAVVAIKCEALYGIHNEISINECTKLVNATHENEAVWRPLRLMVRF